MGLTALHLGLQARQANAQTTSCRSGSASIRVDHVTIAVRDLESAAHLFRDTLGFSLKPGQVHDNGLRNLHIRFRDGSALELMATGDGRADGLSERYRRFLEGGEGGAFVALRAGPVDSVLARLGELANEASVQRGPAIEWVAFPEDHWSQPIYFVHVRDRPPDERGQLLHASGASGVAEVRVETGEPQRLADLLGRFGSVPCGEVQSPGRPGGVAYSLGGGTLVALPADPAEVPRRVTGIVLKGDMQRPRVRAAGVWLDWEGKGP